MKLTDKLKEISSRLEKATTNHVPFVQNDMLRPGWIKDSEAKLALLNNAEEDIKLLLEICRIQGEALDKYKRQGTFKPYDEDIEIDDFGKKARQALAEIEGLI